MELSCIRKSTSGYTISLGKIWVKRNCTDALNTCF